MAVLEWYLRYSILTYDFYLSEKSNNLGLKEREGTLDGKYTGTQSFNTWYIIRWLNILGDFN